jgi:threonine/homoserine/homoserine lactone efflux protein
MIYSFQELFVVVKWAGVGFLVYLGFSQILKKGAAATCSTEGTRSRAAMFWKGFITSSSNPKAVVFFAALLPQFVDPSRPTAYQYLILGMAYMIIDGCFLLFYGYFADWIAKRFDKHIDRYLNRISGSLLIVSALLLSLKGIGDRI